MVWVLAAPGRYPVCGGSVALPRILLAHPSLAFVLRWRAALGGAALAVTWAADI